MTSDDTKPAVLSAARPVLAWAKQDEIQGRPDEWEAYAGPYRLRIERRGENDYRDADGDGTPHPDFVTAQLAAEALCRARLPQNMAGDQRALDALAAGEVPEGLCLAIFAASDAQQGESPDDTAAEWARLLPDAREEMTRQGLALYTQGRAAGRAEGEAEREAIHALARAEAQSAVEHAAEQTASLTKLAATIARLQAERDAAHDEYIAATERADIAEATVGNLQAELAEAGRQRSLDFDAGRAHLAEMIAKHEYGLDAARVEWARVEREACAALLAVVDRITFDAPDDKPNGPGEQAIDDISKALNLDAWPLYLHPRIAELNGYMATLTKAWADEARDLKAAASVLRARAEGRPPCPGEGWEWDAFALQWHQPGAKGKAIATSRTRGEGQGS